MTDRPDDQGRATVAKFSADADDQRAVEREVLGVRDDALPASAPTRRWELPLPPGVKMPPRKPRSNLPLATR